MTEQDAIYSQGFNVRFEYPLCYTHGVFSPDSDLLASVMDRKKENRKHKAMACVDGGVAEAHPSLCADIQRYARQYGHIFELVAPPEVLPGGEDAKLGWDEVRRIMAALGDTHMCRQSFVLAVGGGGILDMVGFAASLVHRGLRTIRIPTTVLAQNDAGVGVKTGMNEHDAKNFIGSFAPPFAVINDSTFLTTLDQKHWIGGVAEAVKVALIKDADFFEFLHDSAVALRDRDMDCMETCIRRCAAIHLDHIRSAGDPFEFGTARPLDFGHWCAHELEVMSGYRFGHGQAVSVGIALDSYHAMRLGLLSERELKRIVECFTKAGLPVWTELLSQQSGDGGLQVLEGLEKFREHLGGTLTVTLPKSIGHSCEVNAIDAAIVRDGIEFLGSIPSR